MEKKYIHYCWFGGKPLPKIAKKCIKSWKKFLPDYEIKEWNESNVDFNACPFVKEAYENKKWAFVADYARTKAIYEMGGIYFDTDMLIKKPIDFLLDKGTFLGVEDSMMVNAAVWGAKEPKSYFAKRMLDFYESQEHFDVDDMFKMSIPRVITKILDEFEFDPSKDEIQVLNKDIHIYPRDYFYPLSYDFNNNKFTENTCMIHYFEATWLPKNVVFETKLVRKLGQRKAYFLINRVRFAKRAIKKAVKLLLFPLVLYRRYRFKISKKYILGIKQAMDDIKNVEKDYVIFHNPEWLGVTNATIELFESRVRCGELLRKKDIKKIGKIILKSNIKQVVFSAMCIGWKDLAVYLKENNKNLKVKVFWHGSNSQVSEPYGWERNIEIFEMNKKGIIDVIGTCKESILEFYKKEGYNTAFIANNVNTDDIKSNKIRVGIYAAKCDDWRKNMFAQIAAVSLIPNACVDIVPKSKEAEMFAKKIGLEITGIDTAISREKLQIRMSKNDINLYVTFSECAPMLPIESFELGVPCILGNNNHYFRNTDLEEYLVVKNEENPESIAKQIEKCLNNKNEIVEMYKKWKNNNNKFSKQSVVDFLNM